jgi:hypothetical protein
MGQRRGGYKVWRKLDKKVKRSIIRPRWKGYLEFMFWGSFSYHYKGTSIIYLLVALPTCYRPSYLLVVSPTC